MKAATQTVLARLPRHGRHAWFLVPLLLVLCLVALPTELDAKAPITVDTIVSRGGQSWNAPKSSAHYFGSFIPAEYPAAARTLIEPAALPTLSTIAKPGSVIGRDGRRRVRNVQDFPYRAIVWLRVSFPGGFVTECSGWVVAPRLVATAGHCVNDAGIGWANEADVVAGLNNQTSFGRARGVEFYTITGWIESRQPEFDYAAILLDKPLGEQTGWIGMAVFDDAALAKLTVRVTGYPADKTPHSLWTMAGPIRRTAPLRLLYSMDTFAGESGAPVYNAQSSRACNFCAVGIHGYGVGSTPGEPYNSGVRVTQRVLDNFLAWRNLP